MSKSKELKELIASGRLDQALAEIAGETSHLSEQSFYNRNTLLRAQNASIDLDKNLNLISQNEYYLTKSRISKAVVDLIDELIKANVFGASTGPSLNNLEKDNINTDKNIIVADSYINRLKEFFRGGAKSKSYNIEQDIQKVINKIIQHHKKNQNILRDDLESLENLAFIVNPGLERNIFLGECERLIEYLLNNLVIDFRIVGEIIDKSICRSISHGGGVASSENINKSVDIIMLSFYLANKNTESKKDTSYFNVNLANSLKQIGVVSINRLDYELLIKIIDSLSLFENVFREMFALGRIMISQGTMDYAIVVIIVRKMSSKISFESQSEQKNNDFNFWVGLIALFIKESNSFHAKKFCKIQLDRVLGEINKDNDSLLYLFENAQMYFYRTAEFLTADAIQSLREWYLIEDQG